MRCRKRGPQSRERKPFCLADPPATLKRMQDRYAWLWDVDMDAAAFEAILSGESGVPPHDRGWALLRLIEYAPYAEIRRLLPLEYFLDQWPVLAPRVRSRTRRQGMEFFYDWHRSQMASHD